MVTYRGARPEERQACLAFADGVFSQPGEPVCFETLIPKMYGEGVDGAPNHYLAVDDEKGIRGMVGVMPDEMIVGEERLKTGFLGTVSVHSDARGEGHMKRLMKMTEDGMRAAGMDLGLLHGERQRYEYFGYAMAGLSYKFILTEGNVRHALRDVNADDLTFEEILSSGEQSRRAYDLYVRRPIHFARSRENFFDYARNYQHRFWAVNRGGKMIGYLTAGRKLNELGEVCVPSLEDLDAVLKKWTLVHALECLEIQLPEWETEKRVHLGSYSGFIMVEHNAQCTVFHPMRTAKVLLTAKSRYAPLADGRLCVESEGERLTMTVQDGKVCVEEGGENPLVLSRLELSKLFFSPFEYENRPAAPAGWFPLPLFAASADNF